MDGRSQPQSDGKETGAQAKSREERRRDREARRKQRLDESLDVGLADTFPGSDPVAVTQPPASACDKDST